MPPPKRVFVNLLADDLVAAREFYVELLGLAVDFEEDWYVHLTAPNGLELGLLRRDHETVPVDWRAAPAGIVVTVVVDDVDETYERAQRRGARILEPPRDLFYGQRRLLLVDPCGTLVDVSTPSAERA